MYFVPVRKLTKIFIYGASTKRERIIPPNECLDTDPESRRKYLRRWQLLIITISAILYIIFYHNSSPNTVFIIQNVSTNIIHRNKGLVVKECSQNMDSGNRSVHVPKNKESELFTATNKGFPVCGSILEHNNTNEYNKSNNRVKYNWISEVALGGYYYPKKCRSRHKVAILVPYWKREKNLAVFAKHMHPFLIKQQLEYRIFIIEQAGKDVFNRGKLFNIAFVEMMKYNDWHCVVLHDVDLLPQSDKILYTCPTFPRHMCGTVLEKAKLTYQQYHTLFGGVSALSVQHYKQINGFSNLYWGWGGEDNDMFWRIQMSRIPIVRYNKTVALYKSLPHRAQPKNKYRYKLLAFTMAKYKTDGLSSLIYNVIWTKFRHLYTHILADVNPLREKITDVYSNMFGFVL